MGTFDAKQYWSSRLAESYSLTGVGWLSLGEPFNRWMYRVRRRVFLRTARPLVAGRQDAAVLDVGSGTGFYVDLWQQLGVPHVTATDLTDVAVTRLSDVFPSVECRQLDIGGELPAELEGRFDAVSAMDVLFHIVDDESYARALDNLGRLVKPGGHVVISDNFLHGGTQRGEHQVSHSKADIERWLQHAGLEPVSRAPMFVLMNTPVDEPSTIQRRVWDYVAAGARRSSRSSAVIGAALYPIETALVRVLREGPSTEIMVCRRRPA